MILILSEKGDKVTDLVIDWLNYYNAHFLRINNEDAVTSFSIKDGHFILSFNNFTFNSQDVKAFWHRRGWINYDFFRNDFFQNANNSVKNHLFQEWKEVESYLYFRLFNINGISNKLSNLNKLIVIDKARAVGFQVPEYFITSTLNDEQNSENLVVKAISDSIEFEKNSKAFTYYTEKIDVVNLRDRIPDTFFPTFFQKSINILYDIRTIFVKNKIWSMAIHALDENDEIIDYRKNYATLRYSPITLPKEFNNKIVKLMKILYLDFAAIDFVVDKQDNIYFLEVNPYGQFEMVSSPCNFHIEREIAKILINESQK
mgnify:CR=1 FL=1